MEKLLNCSCICKEDVIIAVVDQTKDPSLLGVALLILVCIIVFVILGIGFNKLKGDDYDEETNSNPPYY